MIQVKGQWRDYGHWWFAQIHPPQQKALFRYLLKQIEKRVFAANGLRQI